MYSKIALFVTATLALSVAASPSPYKNGPHCNTGPIQCCNQVEEANSVAGAKILSLLGVAAQGLTGQVAAGCTPITVVGAAGGSSCKSTPVCCKDNNINGLVSIGCSPIIIG